MKYFIRWLQLIFYNLTVKKSTILTIFCNPEVLRLRHTTVVMHKSR